jgi:hypothetical protein
MTKSDRDRDRLVVSSVEACTRLPIDTDCGRIQHSHCSEDQVCLQFSVVQLSQQTQKPLAN